MNVHRLAWSSYQSRESLKQEKNAFENAGFVYTRSPSSGRTEGGLEDRDILIINSQFPVTREFLAGLDEGTLLITASNGYDHVDLRSCREENIVVARTPEARARNVCEYVLAAIHSFRRDFPFSGAQLRGGNWDRQGAYRRIEVVGREVLGIVGFGVIGQKLVDSLPRHEFVSILVADPLQKAAIEARDGVEYSGLEALLRKADIVTLHTDRNETTAPLLVREDLQSMREHALLVNTARGDLIRPGDLLHAIRHGPLAGAALDVYPEEPVKDRTLVGEGRVLATPHTAGFGPGLLEALRAELLETARAHREGRTPPHPVRPRSPDQVRQLRSERDAGHEPR